MPRNWESIARVIDEHDDWLSKQEVRLTFGSLQVEGIDNMIPVILFLSGRCSTIGKASEIDPLFIFP